MSTASADAILDLDTPTLDTFYRNRNRHRMWRVVVSGTAIGLITLLLAAAAAFWLTGGRGYVVRTPSMGTAAPVGTLVLTRPTSVDSLHVGQIIAFHPPTEPSETYTHRIVSITDSQVHTRGDINGATDPWTLGNKDIIGRASVVIPRLGWLVRAAPLLIIGNLIVWIASAMLLSRERRGPARTLGFGLLFALACYLLRPFTGVIQLATTSHAHGAAITAVSTGLLPIQLRPVAGHGTAAPVDLRMGEVGISRFTGGKAGNQYLLAAHLHLTWPQWIIMGVVCALPLLWTLVVGYQPEPVSRHRSELVPA
jgi:signal peptidase I